VLDQTRGKQVTDRKRATLVGLIGTSLQFSRAPEIHMREGICNGLQYIYLLIDLSALDLGMDALPGLLKAAGQLGFNGLAVTHPCMIDSPVSGGKGGADAVIKLLEHIVGVEVKAAVS
jgi:hypothetical protein